MDVEHVQTKREIQAVLRAAGGRPKRRLGQHFLIDGNLMRRLVASAELSGEDTVLEVGGGTGGLTDLLARRAGQVVCVEIDPVLCGLLEARFRAVGNVRVVAGDVLETKHRLAPQVHELLEERPGGPGAIKLTANLPYQVAGPLLMNLLMDYPQVKRLCFAVQAEVGARILAQPSRRDYGPLSILAQVLCTREVVARVPPAAFWPAPEVDSMILRLDRVRAPFSGVEEARAFARLVRGAFEHRRKTLRGALSYVVDAASIHRVADRVDTSLRPEAFPVDQWLEIFAAVGAGGNPIAPVPTMNGWLP